MWDRFVLIDTMHRCWYRIKFKIFAAFMISLNDTENAVLYCTTEAVKSQIKTFPYNVCNNVSFNQQWWGPRYFT